jgi:exosortase/archaeosortase family protein
VVTFRTGVEMSGIQSALPHPFASRRFAHRPEGGTGWNGTMRWLIWAASAVVVVWLALSFRTAQVAEAQVNGWLLAHVFALPTLSAPGQPTVYFFQQSPGHGVPGALSALVITPECSVLLMLIPLAALFGLLFGLGRWRTRNLFIGLAVAAIIMILVNQLRLALIVGAIRMFGFAHGYPITHIYLGSVLAVFGFAIAIYFFIKIASGDGSLSDGSPE